MSLTRSTSSSLSFPSGPSDQPFPTQLYPYPPPDIYTPAAGGAPATLSTHSDSAPSEPREDNDDGESLEASRRRKATMGQTTGLDEAFSVNPNPDSATRKILAAKYDMTPRSVQIWFQNRRARIRLAERNGAQINPNDTAALAVINTISKRGRKTGTIYPRKNDPSVNPEAVAEISPKPTTKRAAPKYKPTPAIHQQPPIPGRYYVGGYASTHPPIAQPIFSSNQQHNMLPNPLLPHPYHPQDQEMGSYHPGTRSSHYPPQAQTNLTPTTSTARSLPLPEPQHPGTQNLPQNPQPEPQFYPQVVQDQLKQHTMHEIPIDTLLWGTWRRTLTPPSPHTSNLPEHPDLQMHLDTHHRQLYFTITANNTQFRIEVPFDNVTVITVEDRHYSHDGDLVSGGGVSGPGDLIVTAVSFGIQATKHPSPEEQVPRFYMQTGTTLDWMQCSDFTEHLQGTSVPGFTVLAGGPGESLAVKTALAEVVSRDGWLSRCVGFLKGEENNVGYGSSGGVSLEQQQQQQHQRHQRFVDQADDGGGVEKYDGYGTGGPYLTQSIQQKLQHRNYAARYENNASGAAVGDSGTNAPSSVGYDEQGLLSVVADNLVGLATQGNPQQQPPPPHAYQTPNPTYGSYVSEYSYDAPAVEARASGGLSRQT